MAAIEGIAHPRDVVEWFMSHTRYEWQLQLALQAIQSRGQRREDIRMAYLATAIIASNRSEKMTESEIKEYAAGLANYLLFMNPPEEL